MAEPSGAVVAYDLDEGTGTTSANSGSAGASWNLSGDGTFSWITGPGDGGAMTDDAVEFSGSSHLETSTSLTDPITGNDATLAVLARVDTDNNRQCFAIFGTLGDGIYIRPDSDENVYAGWANGNVQTEVAFDYDDIDNDGLYHRYVLTITAEGSDNTARFYVDGQLVGTATSTLAIPALDRAVLAASTTGGARRLDGAIAAVRLYDSALSAADRAALFTANTTVYPHDVTLGPLSVDDGILAISDPPAAWPAAPLPITVELQLDGTNWTDVTDYVQERDDITITRGQPDEGSDVDPATCSMTVDNTDGRWTPRNPTGAWYGQIGRHIPARVTVVRNSTSYRRIVGEVSSLPQQWDPTGTDVYARIVVSGPLRRLQQGSTPVLSTYKRAALNDPTVVAYWSLEDDDRAVVAANDLNGEPLTTAVATPNFAGYDDAACSAPLVDLNDAQLEGQVGGYTPTGTTQVRFLLAVPDTGATGSVQSVLQCYVGGTIRRFDVAWTSANGGSLRLDIDDDDLATVIESAEIAVAANGKLLLVAASLVNNGSDIDYELSAVEPGKKGKKSVAGTITGYRHLRVGRVKFNNNGGMDNTAVGHLTIHDAAANISPLTDQVNAYLGETAGRRVERLCSERGVTFVAGGDLDDSEPMGPQRPGAFVDLLFLCAATDLGILYEARDRLAVGYLPRTALYELSPQVTFSYTDSELRPDLLPTDDDRFLVNDVTVQQQRGASSRYELESGRLSVLDPPNGAGRIDQQVTVNVQGSGRLIAHAGWRVHLGTVDEQRWPVLTVNFGTSAMLADAAQTAAVLEVDVGSVIRLTDLPAWLPPDDVDLLVVGYEETLNAFRHEVSFNCVPYSPYNIAIRDTDRYDTAGSSLASALTDSATSASVATDSGALWTTTDVPFDVNIGGERITVGAVSGASSPQTFSSLTRSVNGVVKAHSSGDAVSLWTPAIRAL